MFKMASASSRSGSPKSSTRPPMRTSRRQDRRNRPGTHSEGRQSIGRTSRPECSGLRMFVDLEIAVSITGFQVTARRTRSRQRLHDRIEAAIRRRQAHA
ncbi:MAG: hypothetical protein MZU97_24500 [Bacillus subtilis]|nr:hypothetical protein [Bacillus subtilis]